MDGRPWYLDIRAILALVVAVGLVIYAIVIGDTAPLLGAVGTLLGLSAPQAARSQIPRGQESPPPSAGPPAGIGSLLVLLLSGGLLVGAAQSCSLTPRQGAAIGASVGLTCELLRTLLRPEVTGVSADVAMWADRACTAGEAVTAVVLPWAIEDEPSPAVIPPALPGASVMLASGSHRTVAIGCDALRRACLAGEPAGELLDACVVVQDSLRRCRLGRGSVWEAAP